MFLSLVRPDRISSPITRRPAVMISDCGATAGLVMAFLSTFAGCAKRRRRVAPYIGGRDVPMKYPALSILCGQYQWGAHERRIPGFRAGLVGKAAVAPDRICRAPHCERDRPRRCRPA